MRYALIAILAGCHPAPPATIGGRSATEPGITLSLYGAGEDSYALVDDRRFVELRDGHILVSDIDPAASLGSLAIDGTGIEIGACSRSAVVREEAAGPVKPTRQKIVEDEAGNSHMIETGEGERPYVATGVPELENIPTVRCAATGKPGRYLVRAVYITPTIRFRSRIELAFTASATGDGTAHVVSRYALPTPVHGGAVADAILFDGKPGGAKAPREVARGSVALDGSTAILPGTPTDIPAHLRRIFEGVVLDADAQPNDARWGRDSSTVIRAWLELDAELPRGEVFAKITEGGPETVERELVIDTVSRQLVRKDTPNRLPLFVDTDLRGGRERGNQTRAALVTDRIALSIANHGARPLDVWIEERVRPAPKVAKIVTWWPKAAPSPTLGAQYVRTKVVAAPGEITRFGFSIEYR